MATEQSAFEGYLDRSGLCCLGQVVSVDSRARRLRVKTLGMPSQGTDDLDLQGVRVLHGMWHPEGDEEVKLPRPQTYGVILFLGPEAVWLGAFPLDMSTGEGQRKNMLQLDPGDYGVKTIFGNKIVVRTGGTIEVQSTQQCRTFWIPSQNLISSVCQNFELETSGGSMKWLLDKKTEDTTLTLQAWNKLAPTHKLKMQVGKIENSEDLMVDVSMGKVDEKLDIPRRHFQFQIKQDGSLYMEIGEAEKKTSLTINSQTGDITFDTKGKVTGTIDKDVTLTCKENVSVAVKKDVNLNVEGNTTATVKKDFTANVEGKASVSAKGGATVTTDGNAELTAKGNATVKASGNASVSANGKAEFKGNGGTDVGSDAAPTNVKGVAVLLAGGGAPVARLGDTAIGVGNMGAPVVSTIISGSPKVTSG